MTEIRNPFNYDMAAASDDSMLVCESESCTQQHLAEGTSITEIVQRYLQTGVPPESLPGAQYGDFTQTDGKSYQEQLNTLLDARDDFDAMPEDMRANFGNDFTQFLTWVSDPQNEDQVLDFFEKGVYNQPHDSTEDTKDDLVGQTAPSPEGG